MEKFATVSFLAESSQPMLADDCLVSPDVPEGAGRSLGTSRSDVELTHLPKTAKTFVFVRFVSPKG